MVSGDKRFREWVQRQPSCISGRFSEYVHGEGRNPACHVRRASRSGIAFKGDFCCVPMTQAEHLTQHQKGEAGCLAEHLGGQWTRETAAAWFDDQAKAYRERWERLTKAGKP